MTPPYRPSRWVAIRLALAAGMFGACFGLLAYRAGVLQIREADRLKAMAEDQYLRDIELPPRRGRILDRNGTELAASAEVDSIYANPRLIGSGAPQVARALAKALSMDARELGRKLEARRYFTWIKRRVLPEEARAVRDLGISGVYLTREPRRYYPHRTLAGPVLGWAGVDAVGQEGLELQYDRQLRGSRVAVSGLRDALGRDVMAGGIGDIAPLAGSDVVTTIDRHIQLKLEKALEKSVVATRAKAAIAVALDPSNGEILAMAALPTVNPNDPENARQHGVRNRAVTDPFEPGSTMKTFTLAGALEAGVISSGDRWYCENGRYRVGPAWIHDAHPITDATTTEVLARSSNICTAKIAARQGRERLHQTLARFGFGRRTGVDLPGERGGQLREAARMGPVETATISFGQGVTATPLQLAAAYAAIADGGVWHKPHVVRSVMDAAGRTLWRHQDESREVTTPKVAATMRQMLRAVTQKGGTAESLVVPGYSLGGKTGTAQKVDPATRRYSPDKWASSFVGFAPAEHPRMVLFVMIDEPQGQHYGATVAGPVFVETVSDAMRWLGVSPDMPEALPVAEAEGAEALTKGGARMAAAGQPRLLPAEALVDAAAALDEPPGEAGPLEDDAAMGDLEETNEADGALAQVPDFSGMSMAEVLRSARSSGLRIEVSGSGLARAQAPGPGLSRRGTTCRVLFSPPG